MRKLTIRTLRLVMALAAFLLVFLEADRTAPTVLAGRQATAPDSTIASAEALAADAAGFLDGPRARLLILGTFHFDDAGLDEYKPKHPLEILSDRRQREIVEVVDLLAAFEPTRVAVEWPKEIQSRADEAYEKYRRGDLPANRNEVVQLGFRLAHRMGHERVWLVDVKGRRYEPAIDRPAVAKEWGRKDLMKSPWHSRYKKLHEWSDELKTGMSLRDYLVFLSQEPVLRASHGQYFIGGFNLIRGDEYSGPDHLASWWYDRNLRIYANVQALAESPEDRIVLIIGNGHVPILRHAALASPEIELVEVGEVLGRR